MSEIKFVPWSKKPRTTLKSLKPGDVFCFQRSETVFGFGRLMTKVSVGFVGEIFAFTSSTPEIGEAIVREGTRALPPFCLDAYSLFDRKLEGGDWRIIGHQDNFEPADYEGVYFVYGAENCHKRVDIFGSTEPISNEEAEKLPSYSPQGHLDVQDLLDEANYPR